MVHDPRSVLSRSAPPPDVTLAYGDDPDQVADVRLPPVGVPRGPLVVFVHGGFWMSEYDRSHAGPLAVDLAARGYPTVTLEYRRIGRDGGWPTTFDDVAAGLEALPELLSAALAERGDEPIDATMPILMGHSAGGQLVLWAAHRFGPARVRGVVALAPVADLGRGYEWGLGDDAVRLLLGGSPTEYPDRYAAVDPRANPPRGVPVVVVHGVLDRQVPCAIGRDWAATCEDARFVELPDIEHFGVIDPISTAWPSVLDALASLGAVGRG